jgi:hypothetical protein
MFLSTSSCYVLLLLLQVDVEDFDDIKSGFRVKFTFAENPFFTNRCEFRLRASHVTFDKLLHRR